MTKTISTDETIILLALVVAFVAGAAVFGYISDSEAEAKKKCPPACIDPILKPMNWTINKVSIYNKQIDKIDTRLAEVLEGIGTSPITSDEAEEILFELEEIELTANSIRVTAIVANEIITDEAAVCGDGKITPPETCDGILGPQPCSATTCQPIQIP